MSFQKSILLGLVLAPLFLRAQPIYIIPQPVKVLSRPGNFILDANTIIRYNIAQKDLGEAADFLNAAIKNVAGYKLQKNAPQKKTIQLKLEKVEVIGDEGYQMDVTPAAIVIRANKKEGIIYGIQSLLQMLPAIRTNAVLEIPCLAITDYPHFKYRGMHLDVSRHFFGPEFVKEYIDLIASYKMNVFHWHLVDDQGWRIEIKKYPKLVSTGAFRVDHTDMVWGSRPQAKPGQPATYGGYYTQEQIKEIVRYAAVRNVTIIPEIEMPGHVASAIAAYPTLSCSQVPQLPLTGGNYSNMSSNYCAGNDSVFYFLQDVLSEVINLFPSKYIHIGGDEVEKNSWKKCLRCQTRIKNEGLKNEEELQSYFIRRIEKFVTSKGRKIIGWDEILEGGLAPDATVMSWRGEAGGIAAARMNHDVIMTPGNPVYFDNYQSGPAGEPLAIGGMNTLKNVYDYNPVPKELTPAEEKYVLGAQANLWCEFITSASHAAYMILPRMPALAEVVWSPKENKNWDDFNKRLQNHFKRYDLKGLNYSKGNFTVKISPVSQNGKLLIQLSSDIIDSEIYYSIDGTEPTLNSYKYIQQIEMNSSALLKAVTVINGRIMGVQAASQHFVMHNAIAKVVAYAMQPAQNYIANGPNSLTDGVRGTSVIGKYWHGFSGKDMIATIDLGELITIQNISLGCLQNYNDWIFLPRSVKFEVSDDGISFLGIQTVNNPIDINQKNILYDFKTTFPSQKTRYIRVTALNNLCPPGHSGEGKPAWIFADEIIVN